MIPQPTMMTPVSTWQGSTTGALRCGATATTLAEWLTEERERENVGHAVLL